VLNASLWDVMSTGLSKYHENIIEARARKLKIAFFSLMKDEEFITSITYGPNDIKKVKFRFEAAKKMFEEVFGDYPT
jgi:ribosomal protein S8